MGVMSTLPLGLKSWSHPSSLFCPGAEVTLLLGFAFFLGIRSNAQEPEAGPMLFPFR